MQILLVQNFSPPVIYFSISEILAHTLKSVSIPEKHMYKVIEKKNDTLNLKPC